MGKIADLMQQYLETVSREQLEQDVAEIKALGLVGPSMKEFRDSCLKCEELCRYCFFRRRCSRTP